jgi:acyl dehydratase
MNEQAAQTLAKWEKMGGHELGFSSYKTITQEMINKFAEATGDFQWIHVDVERAKTDSPFGTTIAHGYLTQSLIPVLLAEFEEPEHAKMKVNYGIEDFRFQEPVPVGSKVRLKASIHDIKNLRGTLRVKLKVQLEIEGKKKPAYTGIVVLLYQF